MDTDTTKDNDQEGITENQPIVVVNKRQRLSIIIGVTIVVLLFLAIPLGLHFGLKPKPQKKSVSASTKEALEDITELIKGDRSSSVCGSDPCQHGGLCTSDDTGYQCDCPRGFYGLNCERTLRKAPKMRMLEIGNIITPLEAAAKMRDWNGGNVIDPEVDEAVCDSRPCSNDGVCKVDTTGYYCECMGGFYGTVCEIEVDECEGDPCLNGATCNDGVSEYICECAPGYEGLACELEINVCASDPCENGGTCIRGVNQFTCECDGYEGITCDKNENECKNMNHECDLATTRCFDRRGSYECHCLFSFYDYTDTTKRKCKESKEKWLKQLGTVEYPKYLHPSVTIRHGDIFRNHSKRYIAKAESSYHQAPAYPEPDNENELWLKLKHGSFFWPKKNSDKLEVGDIVLTEPKDIIEHLTSIRYKEPAYLIKTAEGLRDFNYKEQWMTLLRPMIKDKALKDLALAGVHNAGAWNIDYSGYIVDHKFNYFAGYGFVYYTFLGKILKTIIAKWSAAHTKNIKSQLEHGYRWFDLRPCSVPKGFKLVYRWWHGLAGSSYIEDDLKDIADFAREHPKEYIILDFTHFARWGDKNRDTYEMSKIMKRQVNYLILKHLTPYACHYDKSLFPVNPPTIDDLDRLTGSTSGNIFILVDDSDIFSMAPTIYMGINDQMKITRKWIQVEDPQTMFNKRSIQLNQYRTKVQITQVSLCSTHNEKVVKAGTRLYADTSNKFYRFLLEKFVPGIKYMHPERMAWFGLFRSLLDMGLDVNRRGLQARNAKLYTSGASVHYRGGNDMYAHWLARPQKYRVNIMDIDAFRSSTIVSTGVLHNYGQIKRQVSISVQGSKLHGWYEWDSEFETKGGKHGYYCGRIEVRIEVTGKERFNQKLTHGEVIFTEGEYAQASEVSVWVQKKGSSNRRWYELLRGNIQTMIDHNEDWYIRGNRGMGDTWFAYASTQYNYFGQRKNCRMRPENANYFREWIDTWEGEN